MGSSTALVGERPKWDEERPKPATGLMTKGAAAKTADSITTVVNVEAPIMAKLPVMQPRGIELYGMRPKYLRYNIWDLEGNMAKTTAKWTETAKPLPRPPPVQLMHPIVADTVSKNPELFKIVTPIKVGVFENLLNDHPNQAFVKSVCNGLRYGFWPWVDLWKPDYPEMLDLSMMDQTDLEREKFFFKQAAHELAKDRYSMSIGPNLLPGMFCMPIYVVPKPHSDKLHLVNDHSASRFSLNSMINHDEVTGYPMDNLAQFGERIVNLQTVSPDLVGPNAITM